MSYAFRSLGHMECEILYVSGSLGLSCRKGNIRAMLQHLLRTILTEAPCEGDHLAGDDQ